MVFNVFRGLSFSRVFNIFEQAFSTVYKRLIAAVIFCFWGCLLFAQQLDNAAILARKQVPVICYHQIRDWRTSDRQRDKDYIIPPATFKAHLKMLADSGYHTILPDELVDYLTKGTPLPTKPVMLTFDDDDSDPYRVARPEMVKYGFKGVFFITTTNISKNKYYMSRQQIRQLFDDGNVIGNHTFTHANFNKMTDADWEKEIDKPNRTLEKITGMPIKYFAFPFGIWNSKHLAQLRQHGFVAAFALDQPRDQTEPIMTIRRVLGCGYWTAEKLDYNLKHDFGTPKKYLAKKTVVAAKATDR